jgi:hypothetical protein
VLDGDLGFFIKMNGLPYHVGMVFGKEVLEARGEPYNKVIARPRKAWEAYKSFRGWYRVKGA